MTTTTKKKTTTRKPRAKVVPIPDLPRNPFAFEVLDAVSNQKTKAKKIEALKRYEDISLKSILIWNFDDSIISVLPPGEVPYVGYEDQTSYSGTLTTKLTHDIRTMHENDSFSLGAGDKQGHTTIRREWKYFYLFVKGGNDALKSIRRETMFINILEGLHPLEAEILTLVKDKKLGEVYNITKDVVVEAYPDIQWGGRS